MCCRIVFCDKEFANLTQLTSEDANRYSDTISIPEIGLEGQEKLRSSSALVVGLGGLGSIVALYLAAAGVGRLGLMDGDSVALSNLQRQILHRTSSLGAKKTSSAYLELSDLNPSVKLETHQAFITKENAGQFIDGYDVIVGCTDTYSSYLTINEECVRLQKPYVFGSVSRFEGQISVFDAFSGPCYKCAFPNVTEEFDKIYPFHGIFSPVPGVIGSIQASECLKLLIGIRSLLVSKLFIYDSLEMSVNVIQISKQPDCPVCGH